MPNTRPLIGRAALALALLAGFSLAQPADPADPPEDREGSPANALRGPDVPDDAVETLVGTTMSGEFMRVEGRPEVAAIERLALEPEIRERVRDLVRARSDAVAILLVDQLDLLKESTDAIKAGDNERAREIQAGLWDALEPEHPRSPLLKPLGKLLDAPRRAVFERLVDEYWEAWIASALGDRIDRPGARERTEERLARQLFDREVRIAYDRSLRRYNEAMEAIYEAVEPTDEQRAFIRETVLGHIKATRLEATPDQRREATLEIYRMLDDERKEKLFGYLLRVAVPDG